MPLQTLAALGGGFAEAADRQIELLRDALFEPCLAPFQPLAILHE